MFLKNTSLRLFSSETFLRGTKPFGYWNNKENIINFLKTLQVELNLNTPNDWNSITQKQIQNNGGSMLLRKYSLNEIKSLACPECKLLFNNNKSNKPPGYWDKQENIQNFLKELKEKLNLNSVEDWNKLTYKQICENGGYRLTIKYSMYEIKSMACPEGKLIFQTSLKPPGYWDKYENIQNFLFELKEKLNLKTPEDWNKLTQKQIQNEGGRTLFKKYTLYDIKCLGCPEGKLIFTPPGKPTGFWDNEENVQKFIFDLKKKFKLQSSSDWNRISKTQIRENGGWGLLYKYSQNKEMQRKINPQISEFDLDIIIKNKKKPGRPNNFGYRSAQRWLFLQVQKLFPHEEIVEDYFHSEISTKTGFPVQFDVFLVHKNIAFEYHGKQHYEDVPTGFSPLELYNNRDKEKKLLCEQFGIQLIIIPYWWDNKIESLQKTIQDSKIKLES